MSKTFLRALVVQMSTVSVRILVVQISKALARKAKIILYPLKALVV